MTTKIENRTIEITISNPHDGRDLVISAEQRDGALTIKIIDDFEDLVVNAPNIIVLNDTVETATITYNKEIEVPA